MKRRTKHFWAMTAILIFFIFTIPNAASGADELDSLNDSFIERQIESLEIEEIQQFWHEIATEYGGFLPESQKGSLMEFLRGDKQFRIDEWGMGLVKYLLHELLVNGKLLGSIILLSVFSVMLQSLQNAFEQKTISKVAYAITYMVLMLIALNSFHVAMDYTKEAISSMVHFMVALLPLLLALMAAIGNITSAALFHPLIVFMVNTSGMVIHHFVLPLLFISTVLSIVSTMTDHYKVTKLANFLRTIAVGVLGVFLTVFLGIISVQGATTAVTDGITVRTAKYIAGNFVPVVGRMFTDAADTVMSASLLLKNTVGVAGLAILLMLCAFPAIKVLSLAVIFHISAAILQPLGAGPITDCLSIIGKAIIFIFASLAVVCLMFFLAITIMIVAGNASVMIR
ncbi:stage III sporulation protein AE [Halalkalibacterium halodurans]|jgi:stage III sporulation protein AE|uniref:Mutants block sporulation after engulfment n=2 Tax=Halalkalibacterium halodurans TaxID=86665 RepID=Q9K957_HALH5|nr:stage III sporulation protein AE [Halalkalibacterium halodurans]MDY7223346.1 stage III sporulation protein AE [Halalkalibacterium halodurans]MDY7242567.1 stage III sporulation protein AE [Halalkalibacterium halodurans]MED3646880.1 stage III sporulation protein AE [Halalkalibacterium halodurans]MED4162870.1 stage III sporulation protein AE [Halalkalibacterium halodurans]MED4174185.1 stage III sporulation protein AE [Halalkalibacterium halodurans]